MASLSVLDFVEQMKRGSSLAELQSALQVKLSAMGFERWAYVTKPAAEPKADREILHSYPASWVEHYCSRNYERLDPVITEGSKAVAPFQWSALYDRASLDCRQQAYLEEAREFGLVDGVGIPIIGLNRSYSVLSMASSKSIVEISRQLEAEKCEIFALSYAFHCAADEFVQSRFAAKGRKPLLTKREQECLLWATRGKSSWEIAEIINSTERTVNFHIGNARRKLGVANRGQAIAKAIIEGHIDP